MLKYVNTEFARTKLTTKTRFVVTSTGYTNQKLIASNIKEANQKITKNYLTTSTTQLGLKPSLKT